MKKGLVTTTTAYTDSGSGALGIPGVPGKAYATTVGSYYTAGNPTSSTLSIPSGAPAFGGTSYTTTLYYNSDSSLQAKSVPAMGGLPAEMTKYDYDAWGRLNGIRNASSTILAGTVFTPIGQLAQFNRGSASNAGYSTYSYDQATGEVLGIEDSAVFSGTGHDVALRQFTRDTAGNVTSSTVASALPAAGTQKTCYTYDGLRELTRAWTPNASSTCATTPSAGVMGGIAPMWNDYTYDTKTGNRTGLTYRSPTGVASTVGYAYPAATAARPHAAGTVSGPVDLGSGAYTYDAAGNQTGRPGQTLTYNEVGKVSKVVNGSATQTNVYNPDGSLLLRVSSVEGAALFVGDTTLQQAAGSTVTSGVRTYAGAGGKPIAERSAKTGVTGTVMTWLFAGLDGTVDTTVIPATGTVQRTFRDPFGVPLAGASGVWADGTGFLGKPVTASSKLTTVGARTYDPVLGKFTSVDPITDPNNPQQNLGYAYSSNNPITLADPSGLEPTYASCTSLSCRNGIAKPPSKPAKMVGTIVRSPSVSAPPQGCSTGAWGCRISEQTQQKERSTCARGVCAATSDSGFYEYTYQHREPIGRPGEFGAIQAMKAFKAAPSRIFPFEVVGCSEFIAATKCELHTGVLKNGGTAAVPWKSNALVGVDTTETSVQFTVLSRGYFDSPGSIIKFSTFTDSGGQTYLQQDGNATGADPIVGVGAVIGASKAAWDQQALNLVNELRR